MEGLSGETTGRVDSGGDVALGLVGVGVFVGLSGGALDNVLGRAENGGGEVAALVAGKSTSARSATRLENIIAS